MESQKADEYRRSINEFADTLKLFVNSFEVYMVKDEQALGEINEMAGGMMQRVNEIGQAHKKRIYLLGELNRTYRELEASHTKFAEKIQDKLKENA